MGKLSKIEKINTEIEKVKNAIAEQQLKLKDLEHQKVHEENAQIVKTVRSFKLTAGELEAFLANYKQSNVQPESEVTTHED